MNQTSSTSPLAPPAPRGIRLAGLDLLRVLAVFLVFGRHLGQLPGDSPKFFLALTRTWNCGGWVGVDLFFVLSGFLVSGLLFSDYQRNGRLHVLNFLFRRGFKIYPAYYVYLVVSLLVGRRLYQESPTFDQAIAHVFFYQNYDRHFMDYWGHLWSIALEEHFYFALAAVMFVTTRLLKNRTNPFSWIPPVFVVVAAAVLAFRCFHATRGPFDYFSDILPTHLRFDSFLFGVLLSYYFHFTPERFLSVAKKYRLLLIVLGVAGFAPAFIFNLDDRFSYTFGFTLYYLAAGALITAFLVTPFRHQNPVIRILTFLGARSYSIYLWHLLVILCCGTLLGELHPAFAHYWITYASCSVFFSLVVGVLLSELIEFPVLKLRNILFPRPQGTAAVTAPPTSVQTASDSLPAPDYSLPTTAESSTHC